MAHTFTICGGDTMFFTETSVGQKVTRGVVVALVGACGSDRDSARTADSFRTYVFWPMHVCASMTYAFSFVFLSCRIASVHSYPFGIASSYSVATSRLYGVALQRSAVRYYLDTGLQRSAVRSAVRYRFAAYGTARHRSPVE